MATDGNPSKPKAGSEATSSEPIPFPIVFADEWDGDFCEPRIEVMVCSKYTGDSDWRTNNKAVKDRLRAALSRPSASSMGQGDGLDLIVDLETCARDIRSFDHFPETHEAIAATIDSVVDRLRGSSEAREVDDDCVSREAVLERIDAIRPILGGFSPGGAKMGSEPYVTLDAVRQAKHDIALMPSLATPAPAPTTGDET